MDGYWPKPSANRLIDRCSGNAAVTETPNSREPMVVTRAYAGTCSGGEGLLGRWVPGRTHRFLFRRIQTLVAIMSNPKSAPAARVSAANALLDRGYGKPPQHVTGENANFVAWLPRPCETAEEWMATVEHRKALSGGPLTQQDDER